MMYPMATLSPHTFSLQLASDRLAPALARHAIDEYLQERVCEKTREDIRLMVTELVANSVRHAAEGPESIVTVSVDIHGSKVCIKVEDSGPGFEPTFRRDYEHGGGFGLYLVHRLSQRWGVRCNGHTHVWFELMRYQTATV
jgi:anti-sigma regulatory factor (Ser/Thr protein kinase)